MEKNCSGTYCEGRWIATLVMGFMAVVVFGAVTALLSPLEGWLGDGIEFLLAASAAAYFMRTLLRMKSMQAKLFPVKK